jgi:pilus assembly protein CpaF
MSILERLNKGRVEELEITTSEEVKTVKFTKNTGKDFEKIKEIVHEKIIDELKSADFNNLTEESENALENKIKEIATETILEGETNYIPSEREQIVQEVVNETLGFGPISPLVADTNVSEIMVNGVDRIYIEQKGKIVLTDIKFKDEGQLLNVIDRIVTPLGRRVDEVSPMCDARLPDGSRVNVIIPPLALKGPTITIRKFSDNPFTVKDLIAFGTISHGVAEFLKSMC